MEKIENSYVILSEGEKEKVLMLSQIDALKVELQLCNYDAIFCYKDFRLIEDEILIDCLMNELSKKQSLTTNDVKLIEMAYSTNKHSEFKRLKKEADTLKAKQIIELLRQKFLSKGGYKLSD